MQEEHLLAARERGADDIVLWSRGASKEDSIKQTQEKGSNGGFTAIIDCVNAPVTFEVVFKCLHRVRRTVYSLRHH